MKLSPEAQGLVRVAVRDLLARSPAFAGLAAPRRAAIASDLTDVSAALIDAVEPASAAGLLAAIDLPGFVAGLIAGTFDSVVDASISQMEAYADLVHEVAGGAAAAAPGAPPRRDALRLRLRPGVAAALARRPLPDLDAADGPVPENIRAVATLTLVYELEALALFAVVDRLVEHFLAGQLPLPREEGDALHGFARAAPSRLDAAERRALYDRVLGPGGGERGEFGDRWRRFLADVQVAAAPVDPRPPDPVGPARASGLALARLASERGGGSTRALARDLAEHARGCLAIVDSPGLITAVGARDRWQVIERVAAGDLGVRPDLVRHRERAAAGATILEWLAAHVDALPAAPLDLTALAGPVARWLAASVGDGGPSGGLRGTASARPRPGPRIRR